MTDKEQQTQYVYCARCSNTCVRNDEDIQQCLGLIRIIRGSSYVLSVGKELTTTETNHIGKNSRRNTTIHEQNTTKSIANNNT